MTHDLIAVYNSLHKLFYIQCQGNTVPDCSRTCAAYRRSTDLLTGRLQKVVNSFTMMVFNMAGSEVMKQGRLPKKNLQQNETAAKGDCSVTFHHR